MIQEVKTDKGTVILDTDSIYIGSDMISDEEKGVRKALGLPITKQLIYYTNKADAWSAVMVEHYQIIEIYNITDRWYTLEVTTKDGISIKMHSDYFAEMQKPNFIAEMSKKS